MNSQNIAVSGATGWLGSELIRILVNNKIFLNSNICPITSSEKIITINNCKFVTKKFENIQASQTFDYYFDFAFLTGEKQRNIGPQKYQEINLEIIRNSVNFIMKNQPKVVILASSGAIYGSYQNQENNLYSELKKVQEIKISEVCNFVGSKLIIARIFNLSGSGIKKISTFVLAELIYRSSRNEKITIKSNYPVFRRYCDVSEMLNLIIELSITNENYVFDSGGTKIEIRELAKRVIQILDSSSKIFSPKINSSLSPDNYFSNSNEYENLVKKHLGLKTVALENQILLTKEALSNRKQA
jgi:nucleoside-diphosphate-sugar epimerase